MGKGSLYNLIFSPPYNNGNCDVTVWYVIQFSLLINVPWKPIAVSVQKTTKM